MHKKEVAFPSRRAQVTVFIILGIVVFLIFVFLFSLSASIKRTELTGEREEVLGRAFNKEALRLFVTDCLEFSLEKGLRSLGQQGTLWRDQGGLIPFQEDTGIVFDGRNIAYGIQREKSVPENVYPCDTATAGICTYRFPDTAVGFGELQFPGIETYENDLAGFLKKEARACVEEWITGEIYPGAQVQEDETAIDMDVTMTDSSILIAARYPLTFVAAGEEYFHLFEFGLDYDSQLRQFLKAAVIYPMRWDWKYVDFDYGVDIFQQTFNYGCILNGVPARCSQSTFSDRLSALGVVVDSQRLGNGDTLFYFTVNKLGAIIKNQANYAFTIARQNRPPALDYISKNPCPDTFDVRVVLDDFEAQGEDLVLPFQVWDPDEDLSIPTISADAVGRASIQEPLEGYQFTIPLEMLQQRTGLHTVQVEASDVYGVKDWQDVRLYTTQFPGERDCPGYTSRGIS